MIYIGNMSNRKPRKKIVLSLTEEKYRWLEDMRVEDYEQEEAMATYVSHLIVREKKRRDEEKMKRSPGRPRKEDGQNVDGEQERMVLHPSQILADQGVMIPESEAEAIRQSGRNI